MPDPQIKVKIVIKTNYRHEQQTGGQRKFSQRHIEGVLVAVYLNNAGNNCAIDKVEGVVCGRKKRERWKGDTDGGCRVRLRLPPFDFLR